MRSFGEKIGREFLNVTELVHNGSYWDLNISDKVCLLRNILYSCVFKQEKKAKSKPYCIVRTKKASSLGLNLVDISVHLPIIHACGAARQLGGASSAWCQDYNPSLIVTLLFLPYSTPINSGCLINNAQSVLSPSTAEYCFFKNLDLNVSLLQKSITTARISSGSLTPVHGKGIIWQTKAPVLEYDCGDSLKLKKTLLTVTSCSQS